MPSFILRNLNPDFWARVQAKAAAEGSTVKAVILRLLAAWLAAVILLGVVGCGSSPTSPTQTASLPPEPTVPAAYVPPAFTLDGRTTCGGPTDTAWTLTMSDAGRDGARFSTAVAHTDTGGCIKTQDNRRVNDPALLGVHGDTAYAAHGAGVTTFTTKAFSCGTSQVTITLTADDGRPILTVLDTSIDYGPCVVELPPFVPTPAPPLPPAPPAPPPGPPPPAPVPFLTATLSASASSVVVGGTLTFTATAGNLQAGETVTSYEWDLDGNLSFEFTTVNSPKTSAPYTTAGLFKATVVVTTSTGRRASGQVSFVVTN
jgi:hypothetical protein